MKYIRSGNASDIEMRSTPPNPANGPGVKPASVVLVSLPKSGTDFTNNALLACTSLRLPDVYSDSQVMTAMREGYYPEDPRLISVGGFDTQTLSTSALKSYSGGGYLVPAHIHASHYNLCALREAGFRRISVLMRDPRDATVSMTYHIGRAGPELRRLHSEFQFVPSDYFEWDHAAQLSYQVRVFLPRAVAWIEGWLGAFEADYEGLDIRLALFDELRRDSRTYMERLLRFHAIKEFDLSNLPRPKAMAHFRRGEHDTWLEEFSEADQAFAEWLIGDRLHCAYTRAALAHRGYRRAEECVEGGNLSQAIRAVLAIVEQFPNDRTAYDKLAELAGRRGSSFPPELIEKTDARFRDHAAIFCRPVDLDMGVQAWACESAL